MFAYILLFALFCFMFTIGGPLVNLFFSIMFGAGMVCIWWLFMPLFGFPEYNWPSDAPQLFWSIFFAATAVSYVGLKPFLKK